MVSFEQGEEGSLSSRRSLDSTESNVVPRTLDVPQVPKEFLHTQLYQSRSGRGDRGTNLDPKSAPLSDRRQLSGLEVGPSQGCEILVLLGKLAEPLDDDGELGEDYIAGVPQEDEVGVVGDVARRRAEVDDGCGGWAVESKDVDMRHDIVSTFLLLQGSFMHLSCVEVLRETCQLRRLCNARRGTHEVGLHLLDGSVGNGESQFLLSDSESEPELPPGSKPRLRVRAPGMSTVHRSSVEGASQRQRRAWPSPWKHSDSRD